MRNLSFVFFLVAVVSALNPCYDKNDSPFPYKLLLYTSDKTNLETHYRKWFEIMYVDLVGLGLSASIVNPRDCAPNEPVSLPSLVIYDNEKGMEIYYLAINKLMQIMNGKD